MGANGFMTVLSHKDLTAGQTCFATRFHHVLRFRGLPAASKSGATKRNSARPSTELNMDDLGHLTLLSNQAGVRRVQEIAGVD